MMARQSVRLSRATILKSLNALHCPSGTTPWNYQLPAGYFLRVVEAGGGRNCARQAGESWDFLATMHAVTRLTSGMAALQSLNASLLQACSCSGVWAPAAADHIETETAVASNNPS